MDAVKIYEQALHDVETNKITLGEFEKRIESLKDVEAVVRCKECKYHHYDSYGNPYCYRGNYGYGWKDEDFCSYAERR